jgi:hypothetical protein
MSDLTPSKLQEFFESFRDTGTQNESKPNLNFADQTINTIVNVISQYGEFLFSSLPKIRPVCKIKNDILFEEKTFLSFLKVIRKSKNSRQLIEELSYFKDRYSDILNKSFLHYELKLLNEGEIIKYPEQLIETFVLEVMKDNIEVEDHHKNEIVDNWENYQNNCRTHRLGLMNQSQLVNHCFAIPQNRKEVFLSHFKRNQIINAWVGCDASVYFSLIENLGERTKKLYTEDYNFSLREYKQKKMLDSEYLDFSLDFIKYLEEQFSCEELLIDSNELTLSLKSLKIIDKNIVYSDIIKKESVEEIFINELLKIDPNKETLIKYYQDFEKSESHSDTLVLLLSSFGLKNNLKNKSLLKKLHQIYLKYSSNNFSENDDVILPGTSDIPSLILSFKELVNLYLFQLESHGLDKFTNPEGS